MAKPFIMRHPSTLVFLAILAVFTLAVTFMSEALGAGVISTSFVKTLGKTLCFCLIAIAMDVVWGYCGILSLGHFAFFGLGGYMIGMWLMYARTEVIVADALAAEAIPPTADEIAAGIGNQIFGVVGSSEFPLIWAFADSLALQLALVVLVPGILAKFGGKVLARGGDYKINEGPEHFERFIVIEFPTLEDGVACFDSDAYQAAAAFRRAPGVGEVENVIVESGDATV